MSATLKDLAPSEKRKVAHLIRQVVEKEAQIRQLEEEEAATAAGTCAGAGAAKAQQLAEQNAELARENTRCECMLASSGRNGDVVNILLCSRRTSCIIGHLGLDPCAACFQCSLRAKLTHAFDLLRAYQHKCRVLDATAQVAAAAAARPTTPAWPDAAAGGPCLSPALLAAHLAVVGADRAHTESVASTCGEAEESGVLEGNLAGAAALPPARSMQLSPVAEAPWEGSYSFDAAGPAETASSRAATAATAALVTAQQLDSLQVVHHGPAGPAAACAQYLQAAPSIAQTQDLCQPSSVSAAGKAEAAAPQAVLPQLETLRLMAQALLEAQANIAAKQAAAAQQPQPQQVQQQQEQPAQPENLQEQEQSCMATSLAAGLPSAAARPPGPSELAAHVLGASSGPHSTCLSSDAHSSAACSSSCGIVASGSCAQQHAGPAAPARVALAVVQQPRAQQRQGLARPCSNRAFDGDLMDLVDDVEGLLQLEETSGWDGSLAGVAGSTWQTAGRVRVCAAAGERVLPPSHEYEENDLLALIAQL